jgi:hypothetical protein
MVEKKLGRITVAVGRRPNKVEQSVADIFARLGNDVEFLPEVLTQGVKNADIAMGGIVWEIKSPTGSGKNTIQDNVKNALKQSRNIILDLRDYHGDAGKVVERYKTDKRALKGIRRLRIITRAGEVLELL